MEGNLIPIFVRIVFLLIISLTHISHAESVVYPEDAGIADVKRDFGAKGDGVTDDTAAIQRALVERRGLIYLPNGTYLVSDTLRWGDRQTRQILQGQSEAGTIIKLTDNAKGYQQPSSPQAVIWTGSAPAQRFRNGVRNLTVDTGTGNLGAIGVQYMANNQGAMRHVTIRSGDGTGVIGLDLGYSNEQGPCLIDHITVNGFDIGISTKHAVNSVTFEHITLANQNVYGFVNDGQIVSIRGFTSTNRIPAFYNKRGASQLTLLDAKLTGGAPDATAIVNEAGLFARNIETGGYQCAIANDAGTGEAARGPNVNEFVSHPIMSLIPGPPCSLNLPIKETPDVPWSPLEHWVSVRKFEPTTTEIIREDGKKATITDWTEAIQQAIDSGARTVYFPAGSYQILGTVHVRGNVERVIGLENSWANALAVQKGTIEFDDGASPVVVWEGFDTSYAALTMVQNTSRTVVIRSTIGNEWARFHQLPGAGDLFLDDVCLGELLIAPGSHVWARQLNMEGERIKRKIHNDAATLWILGYKTEGDTLLLDNRNSAKTEICGGFVYANKANDPDKVMFANDNSSLSFSIGEWVIRNQPFAVVRETRGSETRLLTNADVSHRGIGGMIPLYVGYRGTATQPPVAPTGVKAEPIGTSKVSLSWSAVGLDVDGLIVEESKDGNTFEQIALLPKDRTSMQVHGLKAGTLHTLRVASFNAKGRADAAPVTVATESAAPMGKGTGLRGDYYGSKFFINYTITRTDEVMDFDFKKSLPDGLNPSNLTVRWTGEIEPRYTESYRFQTGRQGTRLWVDGKLIFDGWNRRDWAGSIALVAGKRVPIKLEVRGGDRLILTWKSGNQAEEALPQAQLYPASSPQPEFTLTSDQREVHENEGVEFIVGGLGVSDGDSTLAYTVGGTAVAGKDYKPLAGTVTIPAGQTRATIPVTLLNDDVAEPQKVVLFGLAVSASYNVQGEAVQVEILDDDLPAKGSGVGLRGEYFNDPDLERSVGSRVDPTIDFSWNKSVPFKGVQPKRSNSDTGYSARWTGEICPHFSETYRFELSLSSYGGGRLWIGDQLVVDAWTKKSLRTAQIVLEAGKRYPIKVEFSHRNFYDGRIRFLWSSESQFEEVVPQSQLYEPQP